MYETGFGEYRIAARSELAREDGDDGDLQGASRGTGGFAQAESGRRPPGGPDRAWGRAQGGLLLPAGALRLLEERAARAGAAGRPNRAEESGDFAQFFLTRSGGRLYTDNYGSPF